MFLLNREMVFYDRFRSIARLTSPPFRHNDHNIMMPITVLIVYYDRRSLVGIYEEEEGSNCPYYAGAAQLAARVPGGAHKIRAFGYPLTTELSKF